MWHQLDEQKQKLVAIAGAIVVFYIAYIFSFKHAFEAYQLHRSLQKEASLQLADAAYPHLNKKHSFYQSVLKGYQVKKGEMDTKTWQAVSDLAVGQQVRVSYSPAPQALDTASASNAIQSQQFVLRGSYASLVKLLDTLNKSHHIGKITQLEMASPKPTEENFDKGKLTMRLTLSAVEK